MQGERNGRSAADWNSWVQLKAFKGFNNFNRDCQIHTSGSRRVLFTDNEFTTLSPSHTSKHASSLGVLRRGYLCLPGNWPMSRDSGCHDLERDRHVTVTY